MKLFKKISVCLLSTLCLVALTQTASAVFIENRKIREQFSTCCENPTAENLVIAEKIIREAAETRTINNLTYSDVICPLCKSAFQIAISSSRSLDVVRLLIKYGADVNIKSWRGETPLHNACRSGNIPMIKLLVENSANVNALSDYCKIFGRCSPLCSAAWAIPNSIKTLGLIEEYLASKGADVNHPAYVKAKNKKLSSGSPDPCDGWVKNERGDYDYVYANDINGHERERFEESILRMSPEEANIFIATEKQKIADYENNLKIIEEIENKISLLKALMKTSPEEQKNS